MVLFMSTKVFKKDMHVFCKNHGLGYVKDVTDLSVMGEQIRCFEIFFDKDSITVNVPEAKMASVGIRHLIPKKLVPSIVDILKQSSRAMRIIWSKRSKEYEQKLYSGDIYVIAEVVRDLFRNSTNPARSYTERVIYEKALHRLVSEISAVQAKEYSVIETEMLKILSSYQETYEETSVEHYNQISDVV